VSTSGTIQSTASSSQLRVARFLEALAIAAFLTIYFFSGFAALLYQVVWQRMLAIFSGSDLYATTTIVASFMAGLGAGSLLGGMLADKLSARWQIGAFALAEFFIGVFGLVSKWWYYDVLYVRHAQLASSPIVLAAVLFTSLLIPTCCMGMSFPLLAKAITPAIELAGRRIGSLYALNTLGSAFGAFATAWFLLGSQDLPRILRFGARINLLVALLALVLAAVLWRRLVDVSLALDQPVPEKLRTGTRPAFSFFTWMPIYGLSGFLALSLEIVWFRLLGVMLKSNSFTFPHLLGIFLASLAVGIMAGTWFLNFGKQPARFCLGLQSGIILYAGVSVLFLLWALDDWPAFEWLRTYLAGYEPFDVTPAQRAINNWLSSPVEFLRGITGTQPNFLTLYVLVPAALIAPPTLMMGASFPFLQRAVHDSQAQLGRRVGWLQAANILGATLGAILVGTVFLHFLGTPWTLRLLFALGGTFLLLWVSLFQFRFRRAGYIAALAITAFLMWSIPPGPVLWAKLHGSATENTISTEDGSGVSLLKNDAADFSSTTLVYLNGLGQSWIPYYHVNTIHSQLGILPVMLHREPKEVAVIGLGSGDTPYSLGGREETTAITCIEIVKPQAATLRLLQQRRPYAGLDSLLNDKRTQFVFTDGRTYLATNLKKYDVIEADALRPNSAFAGNLYSYEYFMLLKSRLNPGGLAVTWAPTPRVLETFAKVFPYVFRFDSILIGSAEPIEFDRDAIRARLERPFTQAYFAKAGIDAKGLVLPFLDRKLEDLALDRRSFAFYDVNTDLFPKDEYSR
jgi:predicted membrane-bound spermidine synthase